MRTRSPPASSIRGACSVNCLFGLKLDGTPITPARHAARDRNWQGLHRLLAQESAGRSPAARGHRRLGYDHQRQPRAAAAGADADGCLRGRGHHGARQGCRYRTDCLATTAAASKPPSRPAPRVLTASRLRTEQPRRTARIRSRATSGAIRRASTACRSPTARRAAAASSSTPGRTTCRSRTTGSTTTSARCRAASTSVRANRPMRISPAPRHDSDPGLLLRRAATDQPAAAVLLQPERQRAPQHGRRRTPRSATSCSPARRPAPAASASARAPTTTSSTTTGSAAT